MKSTRLTPRVWCGIGARPIGLLQLDPSSYLNTGFRPSLPRQNPGTFTITDLLRWAKVDPASRGQ